MASDYRPFAVNSDYQPAGDQPQAIRAMAAGLDSGTYQQTLLGVTGSGKTYTLAKTIERVQRPALVISHNKTLAAQLYSEFKSFFPGNQVEYFVSYYDYYQPEAYLPQTDTYIAKDSSINDEIERLRLAASSSLLERRDVIVVASVSCIYGLGSPADVAAMQVQIVVGEGGGRETLLRSLVDMQYERNDLAPRRGCFRAVGDVVEIYPAYREDLLRVEFWGDQVERITRRDPLTNRELAGLTTASVFPAKHFVIPYRRIESALEAIDLELQQRIAFFEKNRRLLEAQRLYQRTIYDMEMMRELGYCSGIENYSRHLAGRPAGSRPYTLMDFFPKDFIVVIDESHVTLPQLGAMYRADRSRKETLVEHGFRLPSALDNRPLKIDEFESLCGQTIYVSATPGRLEFERTVPIEQVVRPTGLLDPVIEVRPLSYQVDDVVGEIRERASRDERVLVTTLTKKTAEELSDYLRRLDLRVRYLHSEIDALERVDLLRSLRSGDFDCLVGINLLREGLDLPEVSLVAILDADKEGFLRSETALMQTAGRAARHLHGKVILYADKNTESMKRMLRISRERRRRQEEYNRKHKITPRSIKRAVQTSLRLYESSGKVVADAIQENGGEYEVAEAIHQIEAEMQEAAEALEFERAAMLRDQLAALNKGRENS